MELGSENSTDGELDVTDSAFDLTASLEVDEDDGLPTLVMLEETTKPNSLLESPQSSDLDRANSMQIVFGRPLLLQDLRQRSLEDKVIQVRSGQGGGHLLAKSYGAVT